MEMLKEAGGKYNLLKYRVRKANVNPFNKNKVYDFGRRVYLTKPRKNNRKVVFDLLAEKIVTNLVKSNYWVLMMDRRDSLYQSNIRKWNEPSSEINRRVQLEAIIYFKNKFLEKSLEKSKEKLQ
jgi:hypothetical protein